MQNRIETDLLKWETTKMNGFLSKQLIELKNGGLKMIKVEPGSTYPLHLHPEKTEYIYVLEGCPDIIIGETAHAGQKEDFFIMPKSVKHSIVNGSMTDCVLLVGSILE
jgi:gluconolactonase